MEPIISLCGDNCSVCPRYRAKTEDELQEVAKLWYKIGLRDEVVTANEMKCSGCSIHNNCAYHLYECTQNHDVKKCNECREYPCQKVKDMLDKMEQLESKCKKVCSETEFDILKQAFFEKEINLNR